MRSDPQMRIAIKQKAEPGGPAFCSWVPTALFFRSASAALPGFLLGRLLLLVFFLLAFLLLGLFLIHFLLFPGGKNRTRSASAWTGLRGADRARLLTASAALPALLGIGRRQPGSCQKPRETKSREKFLHLLFVHHAPPFFNTSKGPLPRLKDLFWLMAAFFILPPACRKRLVSFVRGILRGCRGSNDWTSSGNVHHAQGRIGFARFGDSFTMLSLSRSDATEIFTVEERADRHEIPLTRARKGPIKN